MGATVAPKKKHDACKTPAEALYSINSTDVPPETMSLIGGFLGAH